MDPIGESRSGGRLEDQDVRALRLGNALHRLAAELVEEREHVRRLRRENDDLRSQLGIAAARDQRES
jgi:hypothetical protein